MKTRHYEDVRGQLKTGDVILFDGKGPISMTIKYITRAKWSHVGMVYKIDDMLFCWESTSIGNTPDFDTGKIVNGVQLTLLSDRIRNYNGDDVVIRRLENELSAQQLEDIKTLRTLYRGRPYEKSKIELLKAAYDGVFGANKEDDSSLFCSELLAETYQAARLLPEPPDGLPSNEYTPKDFSRDLDLIGNKFVEEFKILC